MQSLLDDSTVTVRKTETDTSFFLGFYNMDSPITQAFHKLEVIGIPSMEIGIKEDTIQRLSFAFVNGGNKTLDSLRMTNILTSLLCIEPDLLRRRPITEWKNLSFNKGTRVKVLFSFYPERTARRIIEIEYIRMK